MATYTFDKIEYNSNTYVVSDSGALQLTGGQVTGPVTFGDSVTIDEATLGDLVVNGSASFAKNIQANTINGVTVGSSPKFTDTNTEVSTLTLVAGSTAGTSLTSGGKFTLTAGSKTVSFTMPTIPNVPSNIVNTITTTAGAHTAITSQKGNVSFNVPTTAAHVGAAASSHAHGNITNGGDITATAPTIASGDQIIINDHSASKITNGPTFDGSTTTTALTPKGTWETFAKTSAIPTKTTTTPKMDGTAAIGSETTYAAGDHVHPSDTSRVPTTRKVNGKALSSDVTLTGKDIHVGSGSGDNVSIYQTFANLEESLTDTFDTIAIDLDDKVDKVDGKGLSTNDYTTTEKNKLSGIASGAEVNQNAFSTISVKEYASATTTVSIEADSKTDTFSIIAGNNMSITANSTDDSITLSPVFLIAGENNSGLMSSAQASKLAGIATGAEVNQNAFSNVKVGSTTIAADSKTDTLELVAGTGVTLTPDATNDKVTISATSSGGGLVNLQDGTGTGSIEMSNASALKSYQVALGTYNLEDTGDDKDLSNFAFIIGNGISDNARSNLFTVNKSGLVTTHITPTEDYEWNTMYPPNPQVGTQYFTGFEIRDAAGNRTTHMDIHSNEDGSVSGVLGVEKIISGEVVRNQLFLKVEVDGSKTYWLDNPEGFRDAIGLADGNSSATLNSSYITSGSISCIRKGGVVMVRLHAVAVKQLTARTTVATIPSGFRPPGETYGAINGENAFWIVNASGAVQFNAGSARTVYGQIVYTVA